MPNNIIITPKALAIILLASAAQEVKNDCYNYQ